jgi:tetratricopeptide (TPR) repeat protein
MSWLSRIFGGTSDAKSGRMDYVAEAQALERQGDLDAALTSYRLALRDAPNDTGILQAMAIAYSRTSRPEDAMRCYRRALDVDGRLAGAHYGLAFLLLKRGETRAAADHLRAFLADPPTGANAAAHVQHAATTLQQLEHPDGAA